MYNLGRNEAIVHEALLYKQHSLNCMTLVRLKRHGQILMEMMKSPALELTSSMGIEPGDKASKAEQFSVWRNRCFNRLDYSGCRC